MLYLARMIGSRELAGIFNVESSHPVDLFWLLDECTDPYDIEVMEMPTGGIMWDREAPAVPQLSTEDNCDEEIDLSGHSFSDTWCDVFYGKDDNQWVSVGSMVEGHDVYQTMVG